MKTRLRDLLKNNKLLNIVSNRYNLDKEDRKTLNEMISNQGDGTDDGCEYYYITNWYEQPLMDVHDYMKSSIDYSTLSNIDSNNTSTIISLKANRGPILFEIGNELSDAYNYGDLCKNHINQYKHLLKPITKYNYYNIDDISQPVCIYYKNIFDGREGYIIPKILKDRIVNYDKYITTFILLGDNNYFEIYSFEIVNGENILKGIWNGQYGEFKFEFED